ncbi:MAG: VanZ family protein [Chloroflexi bacterium]|nr:VanZ family protein [Chloroflexota bacterium]
MNYMKRFLRYWSPALILMIIIFAFSSQPKGALPDYGDQDFAIKKSAHLFEYALLAVLMLRGVAGETPLRFSHYAWAFALTALYGVSDEIHQAFVPGRESRALDVLFDSLGATISLTLTHLWFRLRPSRRKSEPRHR